MTPATPPPNAPGPDKEHGHFLVQAPVKPMDRDGVGVAMIGTAIFAIGTIILGVLYDDLKARGDAWWLGVGVAGFALGLLGLAYTFRLRHRRTRSES